MANWVIIIIVIIFINIIIIIVIIIIIKIIIIISVLHLSHRREAWELLFITTQYLSICLSRLFVILSFSRKEYRRN